YLCDIFGSARENAGNLTIETLGDIIEGSHILTEENVEELKTKEHSVFLFMGAGDVQKYQQAFEKKLNK
ncbi:MAG: UDP-N-acetylmuramate--L-alanine ligase, partial [Psychrobacillus psychrotolerans]